MTLDEFREQTKNMPGHLNLVFLKDSRCGYFEECSPEVEIGRYDADNFQHFQDKEELECNLFKGEILDPETLMP